MEVRLDPQSEYVLPDGKYDLKGALINAGVKAAVCFKNPKDGIAVAPNTIREMETEEQLLVRGINTIFSDHGSPTEQQTVALEITGIPKILCMVLNNENDYAADERSLRYTEVEPNDYISELEYELYIKWLNIFSEIIEQEHGDFFRRFNKTEVAAKSAIKKMAQENARGFVSVFMPTTITYKVSLAQINKICKYAEKTIENPVTDLEARIVPYLIDFTNQLKSLNVAVTEHAITEICNEEVYEKLEKQHPEMASWHNSNNLFYKNNKGIELSLFAHRNPFSGINLPNEYGVNISYNLEEDFVFVGQAQRHRTQDCEVAMLKEYKFNRPKFILGNDKIIKKFDKDATLVKGNYPMFQLMRINITSSLKRIIQYVASERCCDRAQLGTEQAYAIKMIPDIYEGLQGQLEQLKEQLEQKEQLGELLKQKEQQVESLKPYVKKLRCQFPNYKCPSPCGHPRLNRDI